MRKIKCKAYIKHLKKLVPVDVIDFLNEEVEVNTSEDGGASIYRFDEIELMRYTELTDKNGKEIYEGDIVRHATDEGVYKVIFEDGGFYVKNLFEYDFQTINEYPLEVIGNIFEDKHLLKEESK